MEPQPPRGASLKDWFAMLPSIVICIVFFMVVSLRFGGPLREANASMQQIDAFDQRLPGLVRSEVASQMDEFTNMLEPLSSLKTIEQIGQDIVGLREQLARDGQANSNDTAVRELTAIRRQLTAIERSIALVRSAPAAAGAPTGTPAGGMAPTQASNAAVASGEAIELVPPAPLLVSTQAGYTLEILRHTIVSEGIEFELMITKNTAGEGRVRVVLPYERSQNQIITADGRRIKQGGFTGLVGEDLGRTNMSFRISSGLPMRYVYVFRANEDSSLLCRRIQFEIELDDRDTVFVFEDVLISPE
ncbi:MAG: hypothetical protein AAGI30_11550 [Planctomycetota bacterium]